MKKYKVLPGGYPFEMYSQIKYYLNYTTGEFRRLFQSGQATEEFRNYEKRVINYLGTHGSYPDPAPGDLRKQRDIAYSIYIFLDNLPLYERPCQLDETVLTFDAYVRSRKLALLITP